jgi:CHASE2 domain-containing sensor protein
MRHVRGVRPLLLLLAALLALAVLFAVGRWGGTTLATHHNDSREVGATALLGVCVLSALALIARADLPGESFALLLVAVAVGGGLFAGYARTD